MDDATTVRLRQSVYYLLQNSYSVSYRQLSFLRQLLTQGFTFDVRHDVVEESISFPGVVQWKDVGVREVRCDSHFL